MKCCSVLLGHRKALSLALFSAVAIHSFGAQDTTPPTIPGGLTATVSTCSRVNLAWTESVDPKVQGQASGLAGYKVYRNGNLISYTRAAPPFFQRHESFSFR